MGTYQPTPLGDYLRRKREQLGLSQRQLAARAGVHHSRLASLEKGETTTQPKPEHLQRLADALGIDVSKLLAFLGVKPTRPALPSPRVYFRKAYGMTAEEAKQAEQAIDQLIEGLRHETKQQEGDDYAVRN